LQELDNCFNDTTLIDTTKFMNDSAFRNTNWAVYSTTLGSLLHEFSHILDLGHNLTGIMARGFDDLYKFFTIQFDKCDCYAEYSKVSLLSLIFAKVLNLFIHSF
jgi:hypothetical protein